MDLDDIFIDEDESKLPELVQLRMRKGWSQYQIALAVNLNVLDYSDIEYERVDNPKIKARVKEILESNTAFNPYIFLPKLPKFQPKHQYKLIKQSVTWGKKKTEKNKIRKLTFFKPCKGARGLTHYLFKDKGGSLESFTQVQLMDYRLEEVADGH